MRITAYPVSFNQWKAEVWDGDHMYSQAVAKRPGCAIRDAINEFCLKHDAMPAGQIILDVTQWD